MFPTLIAAGVKSSSSIADLFLPLVPVFLKRIEALIPLSNVNAQTAVMLHLRSYWVKWSFQDQSKLLSIRSNPARVPKSPSSAFILWKFFFHILDNTDITDHNSITLTHSIQFNPFVLYYIIGKLIYDDSTMQSHRVRLLCLVGLDIQ